MGALLHCLSLGFTLLVIADAYTSDPELYPTPKSRVLVTMEMFCIYFNVGNLMCRLFLGPVRWAEVAFLVRRYLLKLVEALIMAIVFNIDVNAGYVVMFGFLLFVQTLHWLAYRKVKQFENDFPWSCLTHTRSAAMFLILFGIDYIVLSLINQMNQGQHFTLAVALELEFSMLAIELTQTVTTYLRMCTASTRQNRALFVHEINLASNVIKSLLFLQFMVKYPTFSLVVLFLHRLYGIVQGTLTSVSLIHVAYQAMRCPNVTPEELRSRNIACVICLEDIVDRAKKMPCGHILHTSCLTIWALRQPTCPTCRSSIFRRPIHNVPTTTNGQVEVPNVARNQN